MGKNGKQWSGERDENTRKKSDSNDIAGNESAVSKKDLAGDKAETAYIEGNAYTGMKNTGKNKKGGKA